MQEAVLYLSKNPEVLEKVKNGEVSLLGTTSKELKAILGAFQLNADPTDSDLWR